MTPVPDDIKHTIGKALGRIPSGVFILTAKNSGGKSTAMMASWVQQAAFNPPTISVAMAKNRPIGQFIQETGVFALSVVPEKDTTLMKKYARGVPPDVDAFAGMNVKQTAGGLTILTDAIAWLECRVLQTAEFGGDHELLIARVTAGELLREGAAFTHLRGNGFHY